MNSRTLAFGIGTALLGICIGLAVGQPTIDASPIPAGPMQVGRYHPTSGDVGSMFITDTTSGQTWHWNGSVWRTLPKPQ